MKFGYRWPLVFALIVCFATFVSAQKTWEKPYQTWSKDDAIRIAQSSPWALTYQSTAGVVAADQLQNARNQRDRVNSGGNGQFAGGAARSVPAPVLVRLHSGLPIRQAITRGRQIAIGYDKFDAERKKEFDDAQKGFLDCVICKNYYVVSITSFPDSSNQTIQEAVFQNSTLELLKGKIVLQNDRGETRELFQFTAPKKIGDSAYLFFARKDDEGNVLLSNDIKDFKLVFKSEFFQASNPYAYYLPKTFEFNVSKLMVGGELLF